MSLNRKARRQFEKNTNSRSAKTVGFATAGSILASQAALISPAAAVSNVVVTDCSDSGSGTLREAIAEANSDSDLTRITFALPALCNDTITLATTLNLISSPLDIQGPGANRLTIDGLLLSTGAIIFEAGNFQPSVASNSLSVSGLTLKGRGIRHYTPGIVASVVINGLVIKEADAAYSLMDVSGDTGSTFVVENSTFTNNHSNGVQGISSLIYASGFGSLYFRNNTVVNNSFSESMIYSTIRDSNNSPSGYFQSNTFVSIDSGTGNWGDEAFYGASLFGNLVSDLGTTNADLCESVVDNGGNLYSAVDNTNSCSASALPTGAQSNGSSAVIANIASTISPSLALNGGTTPTLALLSGSPAIDYYTNGDAGVSGTLPTRDQRGLSRPLGSGYDVGAIEYQVTPTPSVSPKPVTSCKAKTIGSVRFNPDSATLTISGKARLNSYLNSIKKSGCKTVTINGYTAAPSKSTGITTKYRNQLSKSRALAVETYLKSAARQKNLRLTFKIQGLGAKNPIASNKNESGQKLNRRVEIIVK